MKRSSSSDTWVITTGIFRGESVVGSNTKVLDIDYAKLPANVRYAIYDYVYGSADASSSVYLDKPEFDKLDNSVLNTYKDMYENSWQHEYVSGFKLKPFSQTVNTEQ